jgi:hypothetical protein
MSYSMPLPVSPPVQEARGAELSGPDFAAVLLRGLIGMASRSQRREADLMAVVRGANLVADPVRVRGAVRLLQEQGCVKNVLPLSDGGVLLTVTRLAMEQSGPAPKWLSLDDLDDTAPAEAVPAS